MKLRYFYKIDQNKNPIPASNVRRKSKPDGHQWKELLNHCCDPITVPCTCDFRYFVQVDPRGNPIDQTLIRRKNRPEPEEGIRYMEVKSSKNICCGIVNWQFITPDLTGSMSISKNFNEIINRVIADTGSFRPVHGEHISILVDTSACEGTPGYIIAVTTEDGSLNYNSTSVDNYDFIFDATKNYHISVTTTCLSE